MNITFKNASILCRTQARNMATLKDIGLRLQSVKNIQKITASMKMVAAAKYNKAERELKPAKPYGQATGDFYSKMQQTDETSTQQSGSQPHIVVALTSDRGLCGAANSSVVRAVRDWLATNPANASNVKVIAVGDKSRAMFQRQLSDRIFCHMTNIGKVSPSFDDASKIAEAIVEAANASSSEGGDSQQPVQASLFYNRFKSIIQYDTTEQRVTPSFASLSSAPISVFQYDSVDEDVLRSFSEFQLAATVYCGLKEAACSEQSARMTAMESASKNAGEMIDKLTLTFNRTRQAAITRELSEIVSGAAAV